MLKKYFNEKAAIWDETIAEKDTAKLERIAGRLDIEPGSVVLDVGTGTGVFIPYLLGCTGDTGRIVALDFAEEMLRKARDKAFKGSINYLQADITRIPLLDNIFDYVVCYSSFPHFQGKPRGLAEIKRVLKPGGKLLICHTSSRTDINHIHHQIELMKKDTLPDSKEMESLLSTAGFTGIKVEDNSDSYLASALKP
jgi:ubiquinone/menaquinone biosynthesis C-methylase UbiE